jgi:hypothetical protein
MFGFAVHPADFFAHPGLAVAEIPPSFAIADFGSKIALSVF